MPNQGRIPKLLIAILDAVGANANPRTKQESTGTLDFLFNPNNKTNSLQYDRGNSKYGDVEVKYIPRGTKTTVVNTQSTTLSTAYKPTFEKANVSATGVFFQQFSLDFAEVEQIVEGRTQMLAGLIESEMEGLRQAVENFFASQVALNFGINRATGTNAARIANILKASDGTINALGLNSFDADMNLNLMKNFGIIGDGNILSLARLAGYKTPITPVAGNYVSDKMLDTYYSRELAANLGVNHAAVVEYGAMQPIVVNRYSSLEGIQGTQTRFATIADPKVPGLVYDLKIHMNTASPEGYFVEFGARFGLFSVPIDAYKVGDPMRGNNGIYRYQFNAA